MRIINNLTHPRKIFFQCVDICNERYRKGDDLKFYREIISQHQENDDINTLISSDAFLNKIYDTLKGWAYLQSSKVYYIEPSSPGGALKTVPHTLGKLISSFIHSGFSEDKFYENPFHGQYVVIDSLL